MSADLESMLEELKEVPGVANARLDIIYTFAELTGGVATDLTANAHTLSPTSWGVQREIFGKLKRSAVVTGQRRAISDFENTFPLEGN